MPGREVDWRILNTQKRMVARFARELERDKLEGDGFGGTTFDLLGASNDDVLVLQGTQWTAVPKRDLLAVDDLSDAEVSAGAEGDFLVRNSLGVWANRNWTPADFGVGAAPTRGKFEITVSDVTTFFSENQEAVTTTQGWRIDRTSAANTKPQGIVWRSENSPRWELAMDGASKNLGIFDHSANGGAGAWVMRVSREADATVDLNSPKFWFGRDADDPGAENVFATFYGGDDTDTLQGMRISHYGGVTDNALGLLNRNPAIKTCRFNFNTLWLMGTDILGLNNTDYFFYDNVNNRSRIFIKAESSPVAKIGIGSVNPQAALSVLLDFSASFDNVIQRSFHAQINNDPANRAVNIEMIRAAGVGTWNYLWLNGGLGSSSTAATRVATSTFARAWGWESGDGQMTLVSAPNGTDQTLTRPFNVDFSGGVHRVGFFNVTPQARPAAYTPTNVTADRSYDANATTLDEVADVLGTLIADLQGYGLLQ